MSSDAPDRAGAVPEWPFVSVVVPCHNEARHIDMTLDSLLQQDYPRAALEVIVVDGMSTDGTRERLRKRAVGSERLRVLDNPTRNKSVALNTGICAARGTVVVRADAHARYPSSYVRECVQNLLTSDAANVGGLRVTLPQERTRLGLAIAATIGSRFGNGGATYRTGASTPRWVDTVFCGTFRRELFERIGYFDERIVRGQDREFNQRIRHAGGRILLVPSIRVVYYARSRWGTFVPWLYSSGATPFLVSRITGRRIWSTRNLVPGAFVGLLALSLAGAALAPLAWLALLLLSSYGCALAYFSVYECVRLRNATLLPYLVAAFAATHLIYGVGSWVGALRPLRAFDAGRT